MIDGGSVCVNLAKNSIALVTSMKPNESRLMYYRYVFQLHRKVIYTARPIFFGPARIFNLDFI